MDAISGLQLHSRYSFSDVFLQSFIENSREDFESKKQSYWTGLDFYSPLTIVSFQRAANFYLGENTLFLAETFPETITTNLSFTRSKLTLEPMNLQPGIRKVPGQSVSFRETAETHNLLYTGISITMNISVLQTLDGMKELDSKMHAARASMQATFIHNGVTSFRSAVPRHLLNYENFSGRKYPSTVEELISLQRDTWGAASKSPQAILAVLDAHSRVIEEQGSTAGHTVIMSSDCAYQIGIMDQTNLTYDTIGPDAKANRCRTIEKIGGRRVSVVPLTDARLHGSSDQLMRDTYTTGDMMHFVDSTRSSSAANYKTAHRSIKFPCWYNRYPREYTLIDFMDHSVEFNKAGEINEVLMENLKVALKDGSVLKKMRMNNHKKVDDVDLHKHHQFFDKHGDICKKIGDITPFNLSLINKEFICDTMIIFLRKRVNLDEIKVTKAVVDDEFDKGTIRDFAMQIIDDTKINMTNMKTWARHNISIPFGGFIARPFHTQLMEMIILVASGEVGKFYRSKKNDIVRFDTSSHDLSIALDVSFGTAITEDNKYIIIPAVFGSRIGGGKGCEYASKHGPADPAQWERMKATFGDGEAMGQYSMFAVLQSCNVATSYNFSKRTIDMRGFFDRTEFISMMRDSEDFEERDEYMYPNQALTNFIYEYTGRTLSPITVPGLDFNSQSARMKWSSLVHQGPQEIWNSIHNRWTPITSSTLWGDGMEDLARKEGGCVLVSRK